MKEKMKRPGGERIKTGSFWRITMGILIRDGIVIFQYSFVLCSV
jgi:hypothetical protein